MTKHDYADFMQRNMRRRSDRKARPALFAGWAGWVLVMIIFYWALTGWIFL